MKSAHIQTNTDFKKRLYITKHIKMFIQNIYYTQYEYDNKRAVTSNTVYKYLLILKEIKIERCK